MSTVWIVERMRYRPRDRPTDTAYFRCALAQIKRIDTIRLVFASTFKDDSLSFLEQKFHHLSRLSLPYGLRFFFEIVDKRPTATTIITHCCSFPRRRCIVVISVVTFVSVIVNVIITISVVDINDVVIVRVSGSNQWLKCNGRFYDRFGRLNGDNENCFTTNFCSFTSKNCHRKSEAKSSSFGRTV